MEQAAQIWERLAAEYPDDERAQRALFLGGIARYRLGDFAGAVGAFQRYLENATTLEERAAAHFWQGKSQLAMGDNPAATSRGRRLPALTQPVITAKEPATSCASCHPLHPRRTLT